MSRAVGLIGLERLWCLDMVYMRTSEIGQMRLLLRMTRDICVGIACFRTDDGNAGRA